MRPARRAVATTAAARPASAPRRPPSRRRPPASTAAPRTAPAAPPSPSRRRPRASTAAPRKAAEAPRASDSFPYGEREAIDARTAAALAQERYYSSSSEPKPLTVAHSSDDTPWL